MVALGSKQERFLGRPEPEALAGDKVLAKHRYFPKLGCLRDVAGGAIRSSETGLISRSAECLHGNGACLLLEPPNLPACDVHPLARIGRGEEGIRVPEEVAEDLPPEARM